MGMHISVIEYGVMSYPHPDMAHDPETGMGGWHFARIEYWDNEEPHAFLEHHLWTPPGVTSAVLEDWLDEQLKKHEKRKLL